MQHTALAIKIKLSFVPTRWSKLVAPDATAANDPNSLDPQRRSHQTDFGAELAGRQQALYSSEYRASLDFTAAL